MRLRNDLFFSDGEPGDQEPLLEELFMDLRSAETQSISSIWRIAASATTALFVASAVSPSLTISGGILMALAISSLLMLIPIALYRAKSRSLRHELVEAISVNLGLPRISDEKDAEQKLLQAIFGEEKTTKPLVVKEIGGQRSEKELVQDLEALTRELEMRLRESRGLEKSGE